MMVTLLDGTIIAQALREKLKTRVEKLLRPPTLSIIQVGSDPASTVYVKNQKLKGEEIGIDTKIHQFNEITEVDLIHFISNELKNDDAIIVQLPLPKSIRTQKIISMIRPDQDVDGLHFINVGRRRLGYVEDVFWPCTPLACIEILNYYNIEIEGKHAVIVGRSNLVGRPLATFLEQRNATITQCHSRSKPLSKYTVQGDILIAAIGKARIITSDMVKEEAIVIDVGMNRDEKGKLCGDVDFKKVKEKCSFITPVPGGIGPITVMELFDNTVLASERKQN
ncbi:MAG: bifunctional methylenetetrahydrofolate dehydrogenase/methenyltetrahydrofolate cyclohydrolase [Candidatus Heimdallarchaeota archaeon]|nr:MAG: bifunctional methylenetetrahydrofolate dehydrogenase/methenyltetrahydrofolate cyclohydrolase [Candidatus Heimdallarchaeota archaeon]